MAELERILNGRLTVPVEITNNPTSVKITESVALKVKTTEGSEHLSIKSQSHFDDINNALDLDLVDEDGIGNMVQAAIRDRNNGGGLPFPPGIDTIEEVLYLHDKNGVIKLQINFTRSGHPAGHKYYRCLWYPATNRFHVIKQVGFHF